MGVITFLYIRGLLMADIRLYGNVEKIFTKLDSQDGIADGKISAGIWNGFVSGFNGKTISSFISKKDAISSINYYIKKGYKSSVFAYFKNDEAKVGTKFASSCFDKKENTEAILNNNNFSSDTQTLNSKTYKHNTKLLDVAQENIGLIEITKEEYEYYKKHEPAKLEQTQYKMIKNHGSITDQWCAHTVSSISEEAGLDIGSHKISVNQFINWAKKDYKPIFTNRMNTQNYEKEVTSRGEQIEEQLPKMNEGDFIIWKSSYMANIDGNLKNRTASHIGIIETVDIEKGVVTVIEGNANVFKKDVDGNFKTVKTSSEKINGNQEIGELQEYNLRDGLIRKEYSVDELATMGYSGYINNQRRLVQFACNS